MGIGRSAVITRILTAVVLGGCILLCSPAAGDAVAIGCPDVEVVFARGTGEPPGVGWMGQQFIDALRWRTWGRTVAVYPVDFPAVPEFGPSAAGVADAATHIRDMAADCAGTRLVLAGYSRGAALIGYVTEPTTATRFGAPLAPEVAGHVAAVALLGRPSAAFLDSIGAPPAEIGSSYAAKTIDLCALGDPVCSAGADGAAHGAYAANGMTAQAADFVVERLTPPESIPDQPI
ncbi:cutinase family protein [[Mycobacterium] kokjensenii]|uniref:Cutinase family protein n=1 Tax=[Mycobacterium] kokjensenii TaxID=3064287 RepID=A0ABM9LNJ8_9MYCO|nr:cutinase family protein [Mycolicibacter sp. MU0083]CAJ1502105.1 cutinase family protein [Mycolicibacter sp. MU0083]